MISFQLKKLARKESLDEEDKKNLKKLSIQSLFKFCLERHPIVEGNPRTISKQNLLDQCFVDRWWPQNDDGLGKKKVVEKKKRFEFIRGESARKKFKRLCK